MKDSNVKIYGVRLIPGTPAETPRESALVLKLWRTLENSKLAGGRKRSQAMASVYSVKPDRAGYIIKPVVPATAIFPCSALAAVVATAHLRGLSKIYVNANLDQLCTPAIEET